MGVLFAIYERNMLPIDVRDMIRYFAEIGHIFTFTFGVTKYSPEAHIPSTEG